MSDNPWQRVEDEYNGRIEQVREAQFRKIMQLDAPKPGKFRRFMRRVFRRKQKYVTLNKRHDER